MPAQRKPTALLESNGAFKRNPARSRKDEPNTGRGIGPAPEFLPKEEKSIWDEIVSDCAPGVFQSSDRTMMTMLVHLVAEFRSNPSGFGGRKYPVLLALLARCGMTPADRSRVTMRNDPPKAKPKVGLASFR